MYADFISILVEEKLYLIDHKLKIRHVIRQVNIKYSLKITKTPHIYVTNIFDTSLHLVRIPRHRSLGRIDIRVCANYIYIAEIERLFSIDPQFKIKIV